MDRWMVGWIEADTLDGSSTTVQQTDCTEAFSWVKQLLNNCTIGLKLYLIVEQKKIHKKRLISHLLN